MMNLRRWFVLLGGLALCGAMTLAVGAESYDIGQGNIRVFADAEGQTVTYLGETLEDANPVITGTTEQYSLSLQSQAGQKLHVTLSALQIDLSAWEDAAPVSLTGPGSAIAELSDIVNLNGGRMNAGLEVKSGALYLTCGAGKVGVLNACGGQLGAGIGGGAGSSGCNITVLGGSINAMGGVFGAGIGGGQGGDGSRIVVLDGEVSAKGGAKAAGIGGGWCGRGSAITLAGGRTTAFGVCAIGSGDAGAEAANIDITPAQTDMTMSDSKGEQNSVPVGQSIPVPGWALLTVEEKLSEDVQAPEEPPEAEEVTEAPEEATEEATETTEETTEPTAEVTEETTESTTESTEEATEAVKEDFRSETMSVTDKMGNSHDFTLEQKGYTLRIVSGKEAAEFHCTAKDLDDLSAKGISLLILSFGNRNVRAGMEPIQKALKDAEDVVIRIGSGGRPSLLRDGKSIALYG